MAFTGGGRLEPGCGVDDVARRHPFAGFGTGAERDERLARRDPDPDLELAFLDQRVPNRQRRANGALRVVLVCDRRAEHGHDGVPDELLDRAAEALELGAHAGVVRLQQATHVLRVHPLRARGEADEVAEEAGDDLALLARRSLSCERSPARRAEARVLRVLAFAVRADLHGGRIGLAFRACHPSAARRSCRSGPRAC